MAFLFAGRPSQSTAANGTWTDTAKGGLWSNPANWSGGVIADGQNSVADFGTLNIVADNTIHLDSPRTLGTLKFGDVAPSNDWVLDGNGDSNNVLTLSVTSGVPSVQVNNGRTLTINTNLAGNQGLGTEGTGTLRLRGVNLYSGGTRIGRVLNIDSDAALGVAPASPATNITLNGTLQFAADFTASPLNANRSILLEGGTETLDTQAFQVIYDGTISGQGGLAKMGSGTLVLGGTNAYTGATTVNAGTLQLTGAGKLGNSASPLTINGGVLDLNGTSQSLAGLSGFGGTIANNRSGSVVTLTLAMAGNASDSYFGVVADHTIGTGVVSLDKEGIGIETLRGANTYTGPTVIGGGTLALDGGSLNSNSTLVFNGSGSFVYLGMPGGSTQSLNGVSVNAGDATIESDYGMSGTTSIAFAGFSRSTGAEVKFTAVRGVNGSTNKLVVAALPTNSFIGPAVFFSTGGGSDFAWYDAGGFVRAINYSSDPGTVATPGGTSVSGTYIQVNGPIAAEATNTITTLSITTADGFTLAAGATLTVSGILKTGNSAAAIVGGATIQAPVDSELVIRTDQNFDTLSVNTPIVANGVNALTKGGPGILVLNAPNTYNGDTFLNLGRLQLGNSLASQNSTLTLNLANGLIFTPSIGNFTLGGLAGSGGFSLNDANGSAVALQVGSNNHDSFYSGAMTGTGSLTKLGSGGLTLSGANAYSGGTTIKGGTVRLAGSGALGNYSGTLNLASGTLDLNGVNLSIGALDGSGSEIVNNRSDSQATLSIGTFSHNFGSYSGTIADHTSGTGTIALVVGEGEIEALHGINSYSGGTTIGPGAMLRVNSDSALGVAPISPSLSIVMNSGYLGFDADFTVTPLNSNRSITTKGSSGFYTGSFNVDYAGVISGTGIIGKGGQGKLQLSGANTYTGKTQAGAGALEVTGSIVKNGSDSVSISAGTGFTSASLTRRIRPGQSFAGFGATAISQGLPLAGSSADLRQGLNVAASPIDMAMEWRTRGANEGRRLVSNVLNLTGMSASADGQPPTDPFALQFTYDPAALGGPESLFATNGLIELAWLNTSLNQPNGLWQNATMGNFGTGRSGDVFQNVQSSWDVFASAHSITDANVGDFLGSYGVDTAQHQVWAVVNHNSQFAVVPEPSSVVLAIGGILLAGMRFRRRRPVVNGSRLLLEMPN